MRKQLAIFLLAVFGAGCNATEQRIDIVQTVPSTLPKIAQVQQMTHGPKHHFFGYYAICPWDASGRYLACMIGVGKTCYQVSPPSEPCKRISRTRLSG